MNPLIHEGSLNELLNLHRGDWHKLIFLQRPVQKSTVHLNQILYPIRKKKSITNEDQILKARHTYVQLPLEYGNWEIVIFILIRNI